MDRRDFGAKSPPVKRPVFQRKRQQRDELLAQALKNDGPPAVGLLLALLEAEAGGEDLRINWRLQHIVDLNPAAFQSAMALVHGGPS